MHMIYTYSHHVNDTWIKQLWNIYDTDTCEYIISKL